MGSLRAELFWLILRLAGRAAGRAQAPCPLGESPQFQELPQAQRREACETARAEQWQRIDELIARVGGKG